MPGWFQSFWKEPFLILYVIVVAASLWRYKKYYDTPLRYLPILLMYTLLTELVGTIIRDNAEYSIHLTEFYYNNNWLIFNIYSLIFFFYFLYLYRTYLKAPFWKSLSWIGTGMFILASGINALIDDFRIFSQIYAYTVGALMLIVLSWAYLRQQYRKRNLMPLKSNLLVWISAGVLLFHVGYLPIKYIRSGVAKLEMVQSMLSLIRPIHLGLIVCMYGCFLIGFLLMRRMKQPA